MSKINEQDFFDKKYMTTREIKTMLDVSHSQISYVRRRGILRGAVQIGDSKIFIWDRKQIKKGLESWQLSLKSARGELISDD